MRHSDTVAVLLRELGRRLAALRREAGLTQENLGALTTFSRSTVSVAEIGRQPHARDFWAACEKALDSGGVLAAGFDQIGAVREAEGRAAACAAQEARAEARAWYQGESNAGRAFQYRKLLPAMIKSWRDAWHEPEHGFFIVSLANFQNPPKEPAKATGPSSARHSPDRRHAA